MAVKTSLTNIRLGAPQSVEITANQYPNAELSVQCVSLLDSIELIDGSNSTSCVKGGAIFAGAELLKQIIDEQKEDVTTDGYNIAFDESSYIYACVNGGSIDLSLRHGSDVIQALWFVKDVVEGSAEGVAIDDNGQLTVGIKYACVKVVAIVKSDWSKRAEKLFVIGARYGNTDIADYVDSFPSYALLLSHSSSRIAQGIIGRGALIPPLAANILNYHSTFPVINNIACAGDVKLLRADGTSYINIGYNPDSESYIGIDLMLDAENMTTAVENIYCSSSIENNYLLAFTKNRMDVRVANFTLSKNYITIDPETVYKALFYTDKSTGLTTVCCNELIVTSKIKVGAVSWNYCLFCQGLSQSGKSKNSLLISYIQNDNIFVPFVQGGKNGLLGMKDGAFLTTTTGTLTISTKSI